MADVSDAQLRSAALRNLGLLLFDPSLGFAESLPGMPEHLGNRSAEGAEGEELCLQSYWTPLFHGQWTAKPIRAFFRRVSLKIEEAEFDERTVSPATQAWVARALGSCLRSWSRYGEEPPWLGLRNAARTMAMRLTEFGLEYLRTDSGLLAPRHFDLLPGGADWESPTWAQQGVWLEALVDLHAETEVLDATTREKLHLFCSSHLAVVRDQLDGFLNANAPTVETARILHGVLAYLPLSDGELELETVAWLLTSHLVDSQMENGCWEGNLYSTSEALGAIARAGSVIPGASYPDTLASGLAWVAKRQREGRTFPAPIEGLRIWEYRLDHVSSLLEAARWLMTTPIIHPDDVAWVRRHVPIWLKFALGRRAILPNSLRYAGLWVAGFRKIKDRSVWRRDLRIEPGSIARMAREAIEHTEPGQTARAVPDETDQKKAA